MKRPFFWIAFFYILGILIGQYIANMWCVVLFTALIFLASIKLFFMFRSYEFLAVPIFTIIGIYMVLFANLDVDINVKKFIENNKKITLSGEVLEVLNDSSFLIKCETMSSYNEPVDDEEVDNEQSDVDVNVMIYISEFNLFDEDLDEEELSEDDLTQDDLSEEQLSEELVDLVVGDNVLVFGNASLLNVGDNFGDFNSEKYYKARHIDFVLFADEIEVTNEASLGYKNFIINFRDYVRQFFDDNFSYEASAISKAIVTGDKKAIDDEMRELFSRSGISHIFAISGLHISIITLYIVLILNRLLKIKKKYTSIITMIFLILFNTFVGYPVSCVRATILSFVILIGSLIERETDSSNTLFFAMFAILLYSPLYLWDLGFQMTFLCMFFIIYFNDTKKTNIIVKYIKASSVCFVATFLVLSNSGLTSSVRGVVTNLFIVPSIGIFIIVGMLAVLLGFIFLPLAKPVVYVLNLASDYYMWVCEFLDKGELGIVDVGVIPIGIVLLFYVAVGFIYFYDKYKKVSIIAIVNISLIISLSAFSNRYIFKNTEVHFLDVGQGDCAIIHTYDNKTIIIDGGGHHYKEIDENTGSSIIKPFLDYKNIKTIDMAVISHFDSDHATGIVELIDLVPIKLIAISDYEFEEDNAIYNLFNERVLEKNIPVVKINIGDSFSVNENSFVECIYPLDRKIVGDDGSNSGSNVLRFSYGEIDFLFTGDIAFKDEEVILKSGLNIEAEVLKIAHHGSKNSSSVEFLEACESEYAIYSAGKNNLYNHPSEETISRVLESGIKTSFNTADNGGIMFVTNGEKLKVKTVR